MGNYREKEGKEERRGGTDGGGMKGNGENVGEDKRKEERNDGGKERETAEVHAVLTGEYWSNWREDCHSIYYSCGLTVTRLYTGKHLTSF